MTMFLTVLFICAGMLAGYGGVLVGAAFVPWSCGKALQQQNADMLVTSNTMHKGVKFLLMGLGAMGVVGLLMRLSGAI